MALRYVATGGEDDLVAMYGLQERCVIAWGEGHSSYVSRVAFDPWMTSTEGGSDDGLERVYRLGSVGQDLQLCLWDIDAYDESPCSSNPAAGTGGPDIKRHGSSGSGNLGRLLMSGGNNLVEQAAASRWSQTGSGEQLAHHRRNNSSSSDSNLHRRHNSVGNNLSKLGEAGEAVAGGGSFTFNLGSSKSGGKGGASQLAVPNSIAPSVLRRDMVILPPLVQQKIHAEPLSDILFTPLSFITADFAGHLKCFKRPP